MLKGADWRRGGAGSGRAGVALEAAARRCGGITRPCTVLPAPARPELADRAELADRPAVAARAAVAASGMATVM